MISCTEFIPLYSDLFSFLHEKYGADEVAKHWDYLFEPDGKGIPLIRYAEKDGVRGCFRFWADALNEEAADFTLYLNEQRGFFVCRIDKCPSKGHLLELREKSGFEPYQGYCMHCDSYRASVEKAGLCYIFDFTDTDRAACTKLIYDPARFDGRIIIDENTEIMRRSASDNEYFHRDFHSSMNMCIHYLGEEHGMEDVKEFLSRYTEKYYKNVIMEIRDGGLSVLESFIRDIYHQEKADDVFSAQRDSDSLSIMVNRCPAVSYLKETGREVSAWFPYTTITVMETLAEKSGYKFNMDYYNPENGEARYSFKTLN